MKKRCEQIILASVNKEDSWKMKIVTNWHTLVGESLVHQVVLQGISSDKMFITVKNACLAQELMLQKNALLNKFNGYLAQRLLKDISFKVGSGVKHKKLVPKNLPLAITNTNKQALSVPMINSKEKAALQKVKTSPLQTILQRLLVNSKARK